MMIVRSHLVFYFNRNQSVLLCFYFNWFLSSNFWNPHKSHVSVGFLDLKCWVGLVYYLTAGQDSYYLCIMLGLTKTMEKKQRQWLCILCLIILALLSTAILSIVRLYLPRKTIIECFECLLKESYIRTSVIYCLSLLNVGSVVLFWGTFCFPGIWKLSTAWRDL